ncbi:YeeE/YedE thiosulfate transporter family protein [Perlabentimonas gracilis]|uniref:YeeE/YedE thiosulfate transporter family protein n=1 Tax=Perlabentimonas gracilis TaxID=2715279 RepID=UPI00140CB5CE|nr:YeeE/YedE thiosulfate transporter family protein [Perlabentimonas gracilis]NHB68980.1 YeeE/YedE family protein [Perlabentimonas gracilis]
MGPLIPQGIIGMEWDLVFALLIGIAFGYVLESAGFSSSRRLAGVFYGYDFTVLRVFFTAGVTAMVGVFAMNYLGWIDMSLVYVNPTFIWPAIVGGVVMGFGFILGGYCPGTSVTAAAIGKVDAMVFLIGIFLGITLYGEAFPLIEEFSVSGNLGRLFIFDSLGISAGWFAFLLIAIALIAFGVTAMIEAKVDPENGLADTKGTSYFLPISIALLMGVVLIFTPFKSITGVNEIDKEQLQDEILAGSHYVHPDEVAFKLLNDYHPATLVDVRSRSDAAEFSLPGSVNIPIEQITRKRWREVLSPKGEKVILYSNGTALAEKAWIAARRMGFKNIYVMEGGLNGLFDILENNTMPNNLKMEAEFAYRFRERAKKAFREGALEAKKAEPSPKIDFSETAAARGGC